MKPKYIFTYVLIGNVILVTPKMWQAIFFFLLLQHCDIAVNWSGGLHHAKKFEVIAILCHFLLENGGIYTTWMYSISLLYAHFPCILWTIFRWKHFCDYDGFCILWWILYTVIDFIYDTDVTMLCTCISISISGLWVLLCQRYCDSHSRAVEVSKKIANFPTVIIFN